MTEGLQRLLVILLNQDQHLESVDRVFELTDVLDQLADDGRFAIRGDHHRIERQVSVRYPQGFLVGHHFHGVTPDRTQEEDGPVDDGEKIRKGEKGHDRRECEAHRQDQPHQDEYGQPYDGITLAFYTRLRADTRGTRSARPEVLASRRNWLSASLIGVGSTGECSNRASELVFGATPNRATGI